MTPAKRNLNRFSQSYMQVFTLWSKQIRYDYASTREIMPVSTSKWTL